VGIEAARRQVAESAAKKSEKDTLVEIRVAFAKDILIPTTTRMIKELVEKLRPLTVQVSKPLDICLKGFLSHLSGIDIDMMNLGGINIHTPQNKFIQLFYGYNVGLERLYTFVGLIPAVKYDVDLFAACSLLTKKEVPVLKLKDGTFAGQVTNSVVDSSRSPAKEINMIQTHLPLPLADRENIYAFMSNAWSHVGDTAFDVS
jgi:hypothetical protein